MADGAHVLEVSARGVGTIVVWRRAGAIVADWRLDGARTSRAGEAAGATGEVRSLDRAGSAAPLVVTRGRASVRAMETDAELARCAEAIRRALAGDESALRAVPTPGGTPFQRRVWDLARAIPRGETRTYAEIAALLGSGRGACRAIGQALRRNPLPVVVPCHRVVAAGGPGGYGGDRSGPGLAIKLALLRLESGSDDFASDSGSAGRARRVASTFSSPRNAIPGARRCD